MAGEEFLGTNRAIGAVLFLTASNTAIDVFSALNSSPWTAEAFGGDPKKAASCREYVIHAMAMSTGLCAGSSVIAKSWWPIIGATVLNGYMWWIYERALHRAGAANSTGWDG